MKELSALRLTQIYLVALGVVGLMSLASHLVLDRILQANEGAASVVNVSGRQRMLSQRIAGAGAQLVMGLPGARAELVTATDELEAAHRRLIEGDAALNLPAAKAPELQAIYFDRPYQLDRQVKAFVAEARRLATMPAGDPRMPSTLLPMLAAAREPLLAGLNAVVTTHQTLIERQLGKLDWIQTITFLIVLITLIVEALGIFRPMVRRIVAYTRELRRIATTDPLTGALNRRGFTEGAHVEFARAARYRRRTALLLVDADHFKMINDRYGHPAGDIVLQRLATEMSKVLRPSDLLGRIGGEEFAVLLSETDRNAAIKVADRIRLLVESTPVDTASGRVSVTVSIGVTECPSSRSSLEAAMARADVQLYRAKTAGRNRVECDQAPQTFTPVLVASAGSAA